MKFRAEVRLINTEDTYNARAKLSLYIYETNWLTDRYVDDFTLKSQDWLKSKDDFYQECIDYLNNKPMEELIEMSKKSATRYIEKKGKSLKKYELEKKLSNINIKFEIKD